MINPFAYKDTLGSNEMKTTLKELEVLASKICLLHAEEQGVAYDVNQITSALESTVQMASIKFKCMANYELSIQPESDLSDNDKVAVAAHQAYKKAVGIGQN